MCQVLHTPLTYSWVIFFFILLILFYFRIFTKFHITNPIKQVILYNAERSVHVAMGLIIIFTASTQAWSPYSVYDHTGATS